MPTSKSPRDEQDQLIASMRQSRRILKLFPYMVIILIFIAIAAAYLYWRLQKHQ